MIDEAFAKLWLRLSSAAAFSFYLVVLLIRPGCRGPLEGALAPASLP